MLRRHEESAAAHGYTARLPLTLSTGLDAPGQVVGLVVADDSDTAEARLRLQLTGSVSHDAMTVSLNGNALSQETCKRTDHGGGWQTSTRGSSTRWPLGYCARGRKRGRSCGPLPAAEPDSPGRTTERRACRGLSGSESEHAVRSTLDGQSRLGHDREAAPFQTSSRVSDQGPFKSVPAMSEEWFDEVTTSGLGDPIPFALSRSKGSLAYRQGVLRQAQHERFSKHRRVCKVSGLSPGSTSIGGKR